MENLEEFVQAQKFFDILQREAFQAGEKNKVPFPPHSADRHFRTDAYSVALLYSQGIERLRELEKANVVHISTIAGGSLNSAMSSLTDYFVRQESAFTGDEYEQLARACYSAKNLFKKEKETGTFGRSAVSIRD